MFGLRPQKAEAWWSGLCFVWNIHFCRNIWPTYDLQVWSSSNLIFRLNVKFSPVLLSIYKWFHDGKVFLHAIRRCSSLTAFPFYYDKRNSGKGSGLDKFSVRCLHFDWFRLIVLIFSCLCFVTVYYSNNFYYSHK